MTVIRNKQLYGISQSDLLTGDILRLKVGIEIPADGILIEGDDIIVDETKLTGEALQIRKVPLQKGNSEINTNAISSSIILSGTKVLDGEGKFLVLVVGANSFQAKLQNLLVCEVIEEEKSHLQMKIGFIKKRVWIINLILCSSIFWVLIIQFMVERIKENIFTVGNLKELAHYFLITVSLYRYLIFFFNFLCLFFVVLVFCSRIR